jgi:hypothetical protein
MIPALYPEVDPLRLEAFLGTRDYELIKQFPNVFVLPFYGRGGDPAQKCFGAGLARLMIRNLMLLRNVSIHGPEDTSSASPAWPMAVIRSTWSCIVRANPSGERGWINLTSRRSSSSVPARSRACLMAS